VLLIGAGLSARALRYGQSVFPGREPETVMTARLDPQPLGYSLPQARGLYQRLTQTLEALPGVDAVSMANELQIGAGYARTELTVEDAPDAGTWRPKRA
jgi:hypothetical protein